MAQRFLGSLYLWKVIRHEKCQFSPMPLRASIFGSFSKMQGEGIRMLKKKTCPPSFCIWREFGFDRSSNYYEQGEWLITLNS